MGVVIAQGEAIHGLTHVHPIWVGILIVEAVALGIPWLLTTKILIENQVVVWPMTMAKSVPPSAGT